MFKGVRAIEQERRERRGGVAKGKTEENTAEERRKY